MSRGRVLVTGANGFVGRATVAALQDAGWTVIRGIRRLPSCREEGLARIDLDDPASILCFSEQQRCDAIVHLAARVGWSGATGAEMYVPNVLSTACLAELAARWDCLFVFASAAIVCGAQSQMISSDSPVRIDTEYGKTKWLGEQIIAAAGLTHCILRIAGVFGVHGPEHLGLNRAIDSAIRGVRPLLVGEGSARRNYVYVKDVAQTIVSVLDSRITGEHLLAGRDVLSVAQMVGIVCETFLPNQTPDVQQGVEALNQIVEPSDALPTPLGFREAMRDISVDMVKAREPRR